MKKLLNVLMIVVKILASMLAVEIGAAIYDYCNNGYFYWTEVRDLIPAYAVVVGAAYIGFHIDGIIGTIYKMFHKEVKKPQFVVMKGGDIEGR